MSGIDILPTAEQAQLCDAVQRTLESLFPVSRLDHGATAATLGAETWATVRELGWVGLPLPAEAGGVGYELTDAVLLHRLYARHLLSPCLAATTIAARLALADGNPALASELLSGDRHAAFVLPRTAGGQADEVYLLDAAEAGAFVLLTTDGARLLESQHVAAIEPVAPLDATVPLARGRLRASSTTGALDDTAGLWARALIASELAGLAAAASDLAADYAKLRQQFGKPIGAFQAVAHSCADCALRAEAALAQTTFAGIAVRDGRGDAAFQVAAAGLVASDAAFRNATSNIQVHGGIGFSAESDAHLYLKRALLLRTLLGGDLAQRMSLIQGAPLLE